MIKNIKALCLGYIYFKVEIQVSMVTEMRNINSLSYEWLNYYFVEAFKDTEAYINFTGYNPIKRLIDVYIKRERPRSFDGWYSFYLKPFPAVVQPIVVDDIQTVVINMDARQ